MNRKLLNGFLVLAVAAGGVGTFTSCKDEDFRSDILVGQVGLQDQIDAIRDLTDDEFMANLDKWFDGKAAGMEAQIAALQAIWDNIKAGNYDAVKDYVDGLYKMLFENIFPNEAWFQQIYANQQNIENLLQRASSVSVTSTINPMFGTINLPVGLQSTVLASYVYKANTAVNFPGGVNAGNMAGASYFNATSIANIKAIYSDSEDLENYSFTMVEDEGFGNMGGAIVTINPANIDFSADGYSVELVKSNGDVVMSSEEEGLALSAYDDVLYFNVGRADSENQGVYALAANATKDNYRDLLIDFDDEKSDIKNAFKQALKDKNASSIAHLGEVVLDALKDKVPAYAVKLSWEETTGTGDNATKETVSVLSDFDIAAVVAHPLSYNTNIASQIPAGKKLPMISPLTEYLERIENKLDITFDKADGVEPITIYIGVEEKDGKLYVIFYKDKDMTEPVGEPYEYSNGLNMTADDLQSLADALIGNYNNSVVNSDVIDKINASIESINDALSTVEGRLGDFKMELERAKNSKKLTYAQKLVDLYNEVAQRVNNFLADPNHYLQVMAAYSASDGAHHLSTVYGDPTRFDSSMGDGFTIFASSYNGEVVVPSFKKYVGITAVDGKALTSANASNYNTEMLNTVQPGTTQRFPVEITSAMKGHTLTITYLSVDYRGKCSMQDYYIYVY